MYRGKLDLGLTIRPVMADAFDVIDVVSDKKRADRAAQPPAGRPDQRALSGAGEREVHLLGRQYMLTKQRGGRLPRGRGLSRARCCR